MSELCVWFCWWYNCLIRKYKPYSLNHHINHVIRRWEFCETNKSDDKMIVKMKFRHENKNEENIQKEVSACVKNPIIHK